MQAEKLVSNKKLVEKDIRAQFTDQGYLSYGIIKGVDLDISEEELVKNLDSPIEVISAKRLKRLHSDGNWVDCETVRLCFKSTIAPSHAYIYKCKFEIEKYVFPVTQCSKCWKFGHIKKFCKLNKNVCPKCGGSHVNCEIEVFNVVKDSLIKHSNGSNDTNQDRTENNTKLKYGKRNEKKRRVSKNQTEDRDSTMDFEEISSETEDNPAVDTQKRKKERRFDLWRLLSNMKRIIMSEENCVNKVVLIFKVIIEELKPYFENILSGISLSGTLLNLING
ncbi:unnamed protein product [Chilo suppressalis]|uniref:CCHC-type domain-containing protein n=1 Tax=Chilo suppressalis TaxID=168631 RepID=A0ABN8B2N1_CHISP|nr:unnamed protein product [Chilo suppressalis]